MYGKGNGDEEGYVRGRVYIYRLFYQQILVATEHDVRQCSNL